MNGRKSFLSCSLNSNGVRRAFIYCLLLAFSLIACTSEKLSVQTPPSTQSPAGQTFEPNISKENQQPGLTGRKESEVTPTPAARSFPEPTLSLTVPAPSPTPTIPLPTPDPWSGEKRVNLLILGLDYADWEGTDRVGPPRSDTMILLTLDPVSKTAGMLSIPRDLWVDIPGMIRPNKINAAHRFGELYKLPGGGPDLAKRTVEQLLGIHIDYTARIDFRAFEKFIDEIGGIMVDVPEEISVDPIGPGNTETLQAGLQKIDGPVALAYARNRSTKGGDFTRARRQQQVILAIRNQILKLDNLPRLVLKAPNLYRTLQEGIETNLTLEEVIQLAWLAQKVSSTDIKTAAIGPNETTEEINEEGLYILLPRIDRIRLLLDDVFSISQSSSSR